MDADFVSIALGLLVSLLFSEVYGLSAGGMIVPGYVALYLDKPTGVLLTLVAALLTYLLVFGISKIAIVYGRRRIVMMIITGFLVGSLIRLAHVGSVDALGSAEAFGVSVIGFIIPGLIALWIDRQGVSQTLSVLMTSSVVVRLVLILVGFEVLT